MEQRTALWLAFAVSALVQAQPGVISTVAGTGVPIFSGDDGPATRASINSPFGVAVDRSGNIYIADFLNARIRKIDSTGVIRTIVGCGPITTVCLLPPTVGTVRNAREVAIANPWSVTVDSGGNVYFPEATLHRIRKVTPDGRMTTYAGVGQPGFAGDRGRATNALLNSPGGLTMDSGGNLYFADRGNHRIRKIDNAGTITTVAGTGWTGYNGDNIPALNATLWEPQGVGVDPLGNVFIADTTNHRVRRVSPNGFITTVAGNGLVTVPGVNPTGDGGRATNATLVPWDVKVDALGSLYIADWAGLRIRKVDALTTIIVTIAGTGGQGFSGDGGLGPRALINQPTGLALDVLGAVYFADSGNHRIRRVNAGPLGQPRIRTVNPVVPAFMGRSGLSSNMYAEIFGDNFSQTQQAWAANDFSGPNAPTSLNGVQVTVNDKPAFISYVSPMQININLPEDTQNGPVDLKVQTSAGTSNTVKVDRRPVSPALQTAPEFIRNGTQYVIAFTSDFKFYVGHPDTVTGLPFVTAKPGDVVAIYALGLGPTNPLTSAGVVAEQASDVTSRHEVTIGGVPAPVLFAGMVQGSVGLYQLNVVIPPVGAADQKIELLVDGVPNNQDLFIPIGP